MKLITLCFFVSLVSLNVSAQSTFISSFAGLTTYGSPFHNYNGNFINQNHSSLEAFVSLTHNRRNNKDIEIDLGFTNRIKDGYQTNLAPIMYEQFFLSLRIIPHHRLNLINDILSFDVGAGLFFNTLLDENIYKSTYIDYDEVNNFAKINTLGLLSDYKLNFNFGRKRGGTFILGAQLGVDVLTTIPVSQLLLFNQYIGYKFSF